MSMASSGIAPIRFDHQLKICFDIEFEWGFGLSNMLVLQVISFRKSGATHFMKHDASLSSVIQRMGAASATIEEKGEILKEFHQIGREVYEALCTEFSSGPLLKVDDVVEIADSILDNCLDFSFLSYTCRGRTEAKVMDRFQVGIQFLRSFLVFSKHNGVPLHDLLKLIQPIAMDAAGVFLTSGYSNSVNAEWTKEVESKCLAWDAMATELQIYRAYSQALRTQIRGFRCTFNILVDFVGSLISLLWNVLRYSDSTLEDQLTMLYARLRFCRANLKSFGGKFMVQIGGWICDAGSFICSLHQMDEKSDLDRISDLVQGFDAIEAQILPQTSVSNDLLHADHSTNINICQGNEADLKLLEDTQMPSHQPPQTITPQVVDFQDDEVLPILNELIRGSKQLRIVPIYGMAGIGKTAFALNLYDHRSIMYHFQARASCTISQVLDKKKLLVQLLNQINKSSSYSGMNEDDLANALRRNLKGKRYLILLDDVWYPDVWISLRASFPDDSTQSRVIMTSRRSDIAPPSLINGNPYSLRLRKDHESFEILQMKLSHEVGWNSVIGMEIAKLCKGLPLMVVIVAGLLAPMEQQGWEEILDHLSSGALSREQQCYSAVELSFKHLPDDLKLCFLYIGAFPEGEEISVKRLIQLWMAEGFVKHKNVGRECLENLIQRSLVMVSRGRATDGIQSLQIHNMLRDFCVRKAREENCFHLLREDQLSDFNQPHCLQRLCIYSNPFQFKNSKLFCPRAHSLMLFSLPLVPDDHYLFDMAFIIQIFKLLKVLDLFDFDFVAEIPNEIGYLTRLTYLSLRCLQPVIPSSIGNLANLETFIAKFYMSFEVISFPETLWNLQKLKYLQIKANGGFRLPVDNLENSSNILELDTLCGVVFNSDGSMEKQLKKFQNIRRLKCKIIPAVEKTVQVSKIVVPDILNQLQSLTVSGEGRLQCEFGSAQNLTKVTLQSFELSREQTAAIGKLPNLEVLSLRNISFLGGTLDMEEGDFSKLEHFRLYTYRHDGLKSWTASDEQLPSLKTLMFGLCNVLEEIPSTCLMTSSTLEEIHVYNCCFALERVVRAIEEVHTDCGSYVKVFIHSI